MGRDRGEGRTRRRRCPRCGHRAVLKEPTFPIDSTESKERDEKLKEGLGKGRYSIEQLYRNQKTVTVIDHVRAHQNKQVQCCYPGSLRPPSLLQPISRDPSKPRSNYPNIQFAMLILEGTIGGQRRSAEAAAARCTGASFRGAVPSMLSVFHVAHFMSNHTVAISVFRRPPTQLILQYLQQQVDGEVGEQSMATTIT
ncbi:hypothetical protein B0H13DRAFT_1898337 [Mycena leptocephala]|nr:hypothetical protein B0H13DRAFT_1898337 [Mycena leptocephala]